MIISSYKELRVFQSAMTACFRIFQLTKEFPSEERFALVDQVRRSSRSVCANLAEAWRKRRFQAAFTAKLDDAAGEAAETQVWIEIARSCNYLSEKSARDLHATYEQIGAQLIAMAQHSERWLIPASVPSSETREGSSHRVSTPRVSPRPC
jgi:four helix bundle protein